MIDINLVKYYIIDLNNCYIEIILINIYLIVNLYVNGINLIF